MQLCDIAVWTGLECPPIHVTSHARCSALLKARLATLMSPSSPAQQAHRTQHRDSDKRYNRAQMSFQSQDTARTQYPQTQPRAPAECGGRVSGAIRVLAGPEGVADNGAAHGEAGSHGGEARGLPAEPSSGDQSELPWLGQAPGPCYQSPAGH